MELGAVIAITTILSCLLILSGKLTKLQNTVDELKNLIEKTNKPDSNRPQIQS